MTPASRYQKIVHLTSVHPRYDARVFLKECRSLVVAGNDVTLVVADGQGEETRDGVRIVDVGKPRGRMWRMWRSVNDVASAGLALGADVYHFHDPELLRVAGRLLRSRKGVHVVFDAHEDVPRQILSKQWIPAPLRKIVSWVVEQIEKRVARRLSGIIAATPHIAKRFRPINPHTVDINNYPMPDELAPAAIKLAARKRQVCYVGGLTKVRGIESLVRALPFMPDVALVLCGRFQESAFEAKIRALPGWSQVSYRGQVDREGVKDVLAESSCGIVTLLATPAYVEALPVKMFEYMSAELPVIASNFPLWRQIVESAGAGMCVDPDSPEAIANAIRRLLDDPNTIEGMGSAGRKSVLEKYNWANEARKLISFYKELQ